MQVGKVRNRDQRMPLIGRFYLVMYVARIRACMYMYVYMHSLFIPFHFMFFFFFSLFLLVSLVLVVVVVLQSFFV